MYGQTSVSKPRLGLAYVWHLLVIARPQIFGPDFQFSELTGHMSSNCQTLDLVQEIEVHEIES